MCGGGDGGRFGPRIDAGELHRAALLPRPLYGECHDRNDADW